MTHPEVQDPGGRPSGKAGAHTLLATGVRACVYALTYEAVLVWLEVYGYSLTRRSSACVFLSPIATFVFSVALHRSYVRTIQRGRVTRPSSRLAIEVVGGLTALYAAWVFDRWLRLGPMGNGSGGFSLMPPAILDHLRRFVDEGYWGWGYSWYYDRATVKGPILILWWILEAALIVAVPSLLEARRLHRQPLCPSCAGDMEFIPNVHRMQESQAARVQERLLAGDVSIVEEPRGPLGKDRLSLQFDLFVCTQCREVALLTLTLAGRVLLWRMQVTAEEARRVMKAGAPKLAR